MQNKSSERTYNFIDLFAGAGGLSEGFMQAGFSPIAHVEMNSYAAKTLETRTGYFYLKEQGKLNNYHDYLKGNISREKFLEYIPERLLQSVICETMSNETLPGLFERIDKSMKEQGISHVDVIIGGPPCQAYSLVGRAQSSHMKVPMNEDPRNDLYKLYARFLKKYQPEILVLVRKQSEAKDGDIVVALVANENMLKRYFVDKENQKIRLHPENKTMKDIIVSDCKIQGVAVKVIKNLE